MMKEATGKLVQDVDLAWDEEVRKDLLVFFEGVKTPYSCLPVGRLRLIPCGIGEGRWVKQLAKANTKGDDSDGR